MKTGYGVIKELGKQGLRGYFFNYRQFKVLATINDFSEVKSKIAEWGYPEVNSANDASEIVAILKKSNAMTETQKGCFTAMILEPLFWIILFLFSGC